MARASAAQDIDLSQTQRTFLFAREQVAAHSRVGSYLAVRRLRRWTQPSSSTIEGA